MATPRIENPGSQIAMRGRPFIKMHGLGNHFVIVDARADPYRPHTDEIVNVCDVRVGIGADQLVVIEPPESSSADAFMRLYNVDGREVGACGNATRCVAWLLLEEGERSTVFIETLAGLLTCRRSGDRQVTCDMGAVKTDWRDIPLSRAVDTGDLGFAVGPLTGGVAVNLGNPHVVFFVDDLDAIDVSAIAPTLQDDPLFPDSVNVGVAQVTGPLSMRLVVFERGVGLTMACGSGACAAVHAANLHGLLGNGPVDVTLPGGVVEIAITSEHRAVMTGPVALSFAGILPVD